MSYNLYDDLGFTDKEQLYNRVSHARVLEYLNKYPIVSNHRDHNSYGEFRFITVMLPRKRNGGSAYREAVTFYGNGYHEYRDTSPATWSFNVGNGCLYHDAQPLNRRQAIKEINDEHAAMSFDDTPKDNTFTFIADLTDDDAALAYINEY